MKVLLPLILLCGSVYGQSLKIEQMEIAPYFNWNSYPKFVYAINSVTSNAVIIKGQSWGIKASYKLPVNEFYLKAGFGYYKYRFNKIRQINTLGGKSSNRIIDYTPDDAYTPSINFTTNNYWYNTISLNVGIEKPFFLSKEMQIVGGVDVNNYFTFSQTYHITYPHPKGYDYKTSDKRFFGFSANVFVGLQKELKKFKIGPSLEIPIFSMWKKDKKFPQETNNDNRRKWLKGWGIGVTYTFPLTKK